MQCRNSISSCSKAPWGLSVLLRVTGIFTGTTITPSLLLRQRPDRYAFRAGQNLPDKEFRYLRTVIVTAAVHPGSYPAGNIAEHQRERTGVRPVFAEEKYPYPKGDSTNTGVLVSQSPTYPVRAMPKLNIKLQ